MLTVEDGLIKLTVGDLHCVTVYVSVSVPHAFVAVITKVFNPSAKFTFWLIEPVVHESPFTMLPFFVTCTLVLASYPAIEALIITELDVVLDPLAMLPLMVTSGIMQLMKFTVEVSESVPQLFVAVK